MSFSLLSNIPSPSFTQTINKHIEPLNFPECPGVYVMIDRKGEIAYTGKTKNLRQRIHNHVTSSHNKGVEKDIAENNIKEIMVFCCDSELDSIVLERYFIQSNIYRGKHNIQYASPNSNDSSLIKKKPISRLLNKNVIETADQNELRNLRDEVQSLKNDFSKLMDSIEEIKRNNVTQGEMINVTREKLNSNTAELHKILGLITESFGMVNKGFDLFREADKVQQRGLEVIYTSIPYCVDKTFEAISEVVTVSQEANNELRDLKLSTLKRELESKIRKVEQKNKGNFFSKIFKRP